ncbi:MAG TPA: hypothetical protein VFR24_17720 [Candidatus Angelobacter sp.]|nr:hypothetical protein [Candidatus Angelobacter sp.]
MYRILFANVKCFLAWGQLIPMEESRPLCRALPLVASVNNRNNLTMLRFTRLLSAVLNLLSLPAVLCVPVLAVACSAQTKEYNILVDGRTIGREILTANQDGTRLDTKMEVTDSAGNTLKSDLEEQFSPGGSNKWLLYSTLIKGKKATVEMVWIGDKVAKIELVDVNGQKSSPAGENDSGITSSTAMGLDLSVSAYRIATQRALKSGIPAKIGIMTIPAGGQAGVVPVRVEKMGVIQTFMISKKPIQTQEYTFTEIPDPGQLTDPPVKVWVEVESGEVVAVRMPEKFSIVQRGLSPSDLLRLK